MPTSSRSPSRTTCDGQAALVGGDRRRGHRLHQRPDARVPRQHPDRDVQLADHVREPAVGAERQVPRPLPGREDRRDAVLDQPAVLAAVAADLVGAQVDHQHERAARVEGDEVRVRRLLPVLVGTRPGVPEHLRRTLRREPAVLVQRQDAERARGVVGDEQRAAVRVEHQVAGVRAARRDRRPVHERVADDVERADRAVRLLVHGVQDRAAVQREEARRRRLDDLPRVAQRTGRRIEVDPPDPLPLTDGRPRTGDGIGTDPQGCLLRAHGPGAYGDSRARRGVRRDVRATRASGRPDARTPLPGGTSEERALRRPDPRTLGAWPTVGAARAAPARWRR